MDFVVLVFALVVRFFVGVMPSTQQDAWFYHLKAQARSWVGHKVPAGFESGSRQTSGVAILLITVFLPVIGLSFLMSWFEQLVFGVPAFFLSLAVLLYSLGRKEYTHWFKRFQIAWRQGDVQGAYRYASEVLPEYQPSSETELYNRTFARLLYLYFTQYFTVVFWFVILGAEGALLARLIQLFGQPSVNPCDKLSRHAQCFVVLIEWVPARLLGLLMIVLSQSLSSLNEWLKQLLLLKPLLQGITTEDQLYRMALCTLGQKLQYQDVGVPLYMKRRFSDQKEEGLVQLAELLQRSAVLAMIMVSIWIVLG